MAAVGLLLSMCLSSCQDDLSVGAGERVEEGLPANVTLRIKVGDMSSYSRSIVDEPNSSYCNNLWIGLYSSTSGERLKYFYITDVENTLEVEGPFYVLNKKLVSANDVYIVAVSNVDVNTAISNINDYGGNDSNLLNLLNSADTYDKFKKICILRPDANDVNVYATSMTMSGWYADNGHSYTDPEDMQTVNIAPGDNVLEGAIYLRRILSYNKFIISAGNNINLSLKSWQVCNVPAGCTVIEETENAADRYNGSAAFFNETLGSHQFTATTATDGSAADSFEFYQVENKHTGLDYAEDDGDHVGIDPNASDYYNEREREYKDKNGDRLANRGVYRSLVKADQSNMHNNDASYVVINADIDYYVLMPDDPKTYDATQAVAVDPTAYDSSKLIHRTANVNYTIHLGYCEDKNSDDTPSIDTAKDFNCRRNSRYTYNVKINGVNKVVVEAKSEDGTEPQPGTDGWVNDDTGEYERLDAHYCEFNICLTEEERKTMYYRITAPYGDSFYYYSRDKEGNITMTDKNMSSELYEWIKFYPTKDKDTLAEYNKGNGSNSLGDGTGLWTFNDMCKPTVKTSPYPAEADGSQWYTVFIDEYVYHFDDQGGVESSWPNYVNKDDRIAEFIIQTHKSMDEESTYSYNKYTFAQKSIQTYYAGRKPGDTAIGIEHEDETYCLNMNLQFYGNDNMHLEERTPERYDYANGRYNLYKYLHDKTNLKWSSVIQATVPAHVNADENTTYGCSHPDADYPVYMPQKGAGKADNQASPKDGNAYYANSICMNRNRDLDGDGEIDDDEIRWYTPTASQYIQISIAQTELPDPIMRFTDYSTDYFSKNWGDDANDRYGTYNFHFIASDDIYYWAEQAVNVGQQPFSGWSPQYTATYAVRCIRNLGTNPGIAPVNGTREVEYAYTHDPDARTFTQNNYADETLRGYNIGGIAPHDFASPSARPYKKFEYAKHLCTNLRNNYISFNGSGSLVYTASCSNISERTADWTNSLRLNGICGQYTQEPDGSDLGTWRMPTAYELALMWIENIPQNTSEMEAGYLSIGANDAFFLSSTYDYFISFKLRNYTTDNHIYLGYNDTGDREVLALDCLTDGNYSSADARIRLRCVRDVRM
jgi:hypothetical protein